MHGARARALLLPLLLQLLAAAPAARAAPAAQAAPAPPGARPRHGRALLSSPAFATPVVLRLAFEPPSAAALVFESPEQRAFAERVAGAIAASLELQPAPAFGGARVVVLGAFADGAAGADASLELDVLLLLRPGASRAAAALLEAAAVEAPAAAALLQDDGGLQRLARSVEPLGAGLTVDELAARATGADAAAAAAAAVLEYCKAQRQLAADEWYGAPTAAGGAFWPPRAWRRRRRALSSSQVLPD